MRLLPKTEVRRLGIMAQLKGGIEMHTHGMIRTFTLVTLGAAALCTTIAVAAAEDSRYPDLRGAWERTFAPRWTAGRE